MAVGMDSVDNFWHVNWSDQSNENVSDVLSALEPVTGEPVSSSVSDFVLNISSMI